MALNSKSKNNIQLEEINELAKKVLSVCEGLNYTATLFVLSQAVEMSKDSCFVECYSKDETSDPRS